MGKVTIGDVLAQAITREEVAHDLYLKLRDKVDDAVSKDTLAFMASEEWRHKEILERYQRGELGAEALGVDKVVDGKVVEALGTPAMTEKLEHKDVFLIAAEREKASYEFYKRLATVQPEGAIKTLFFRLAQEELGHKEKVEYLYCNAAFPQTAGG